MKFSQILILNIKNWTVIRKWVIPPGIAGQHLLFTGNHTRYGSALRFYGNHTWGKLSVTVATGQPEHCADRAEAVSLFNDRCAKGHAFSMCGGIPIYKRIRKE